ncbi:MAG TPA: chemotaxis protein CheB [Oxalicibacterium sp.]|uniref:chemotaxis protein CheB n=1 Tax=Oxalicibacterium sp. TaxID=2766525 RepID=UPI002C974D4B|nr:chemotaxis protein CheB [Oxalicibacterium sp.]HWU98979.1 chemotaxis protein CheB [Oxalicibacterium sp.]
MKTPSTRHLEAIVIGGSAGGIDALLALLPRLPSGYSLPIVIVLHLPDERDSRLAEIFAARLSLPVREARDKETIQPGTVYFAGAGYHLSIEADRSFSLSCEPPLHFSRPSIDILMESAADAYGPALLGILLTGANDDGAAGLCHVQERGGMTVVQDPSEAHIATMPAAAIDIFTPDKILKLQDIHALLLTLDDSHAH